MAWYNRENPGVQKVLMKSCDVTLKHKPETTLVWETEEL